MKIPRMNAIISEDQTLCLIMEEGREEMEREKEPGRESEGGRKREREGARERE